MTDNSEGPATHSSPLWESSQVSRSAYVPRDGKADGHAEFKTPLSSKADCCLDVFFPPSSRSVQLP